MDDFRFHLARTELQNAADGEHGSPLLLSQSPTLTDDGERLSRVIRSCAYAGTARGFGITVAYFFDPSGSTTVVFTWRILLDERCEPTFVAYRNGKKCREESNRLAGEFPDVLARNERYQFRFGLVVGRRELERPAICELIVPSCKASESSDSPETRRLKRDAWKQRQYAEAEGIPGDPQELIQRKAEIDEEARQKFGEM
jgi:hypothetical protein